MVGYRHLDHVNHIFFSAYEKDRPTIADEAKELLSYIPEYNRFFTHVPVEFKYFTVKVTGVISRSLVLNNIKLQIKALLDALYGKDSAGLSDAQSNSDLDEVLSYMSDDLLKSLFGGSTVGRKNVALKRDIYRLMNSLVSQGISVFDEQFKEDIEISIDGFVEPEKSEQGQSLIYQMICIDLDNSSIDISYPERENYGF